MTLKLSYSIPAVIVGALSCGAPFAAPYVPDRDEIVLEKAVGGTNNPQEKELRALQAALRSNPQNLELAVRTARAYIARARETSDPRFIGYAQASLAPWWNTAQAPVPILVLRATIRQNQHEFVPALDDLGRALARDPRNVQAWLTRATVELVSGDPRAARESCTRLAELTAPLITETCLAQAESVLGNAPGAYDALSKALRRPGKLPPELESWSRSILAEIAERLGKYAQAETLYREVLAVSPTDAYTRGAFADFLLDRGRAKEALELVAAHTVADAILLRAVLAATDSGDGRAAALTTEMSQRIDAGRARGDKVHLREEARFELRVRRNPQKALELAIENWAAQKELADARVLMEASLAAGKPAAAGPALQYLSRYRIEAEQLDRLRAQLQKAT